MSMSIMQQQQQQQNEVQEQSRCSYSRSHSCSSISMSRNWLMLLMLLLLAVVVSVSAEQPTIRSERSSTSTRTSTSTGSSSILTTKMITNMNLDNDNDNDNDSTTATTTTTTGSSGGVDTEFADDYDDDFIVFPSFESSSDTEAENQQQYELSSHSSHVSGDDVSVVGSGDVVSVSGMTTTVDRNRILQFASLTPGSGPISPAPTYVDKCYVCGSEDSYVTTPDVNVTIIPGQTALCGALERAGRTGLIPQAGCYVSTTAAQASCNCQLNSPTDSSSGGSNGNGNGDSPVSAPSPTTTTTTTNAVCYLCEDSTLMVGNANETLLNLLLPDGIDPTCGAVEQAGLNQLLNKQICTLASQVAKQICSCQSSGTTTNMPVMAPTPVTSPSPVSSPMTNSPVVVGGGGEPTMTNTAAPTLTAGGGRSPSSSSNGTSSTTDEPTSAPSSAESTPTTSSTLMQFHYYSNPMYVSLMMILFVSIPIAVLV